MRAEGGAMCAEIGVRRAGMVEVPEGMTVSQLPGQAMELPSGVLRLKGRVACRPAGVAQGPG